MFNNYFLNEEFCIFKFLSCYIFLLFCGRLHAARARLRDALGPSPCTYSPCSRKQTAFPGATRLSGEITFRLSAQMLLATLSASPGVLFLHLPSADPGSEITLRSSAGLLVDSLRILIQRHWGLQPIASLHKHRRCQQLVRVPEKCANEL